MKVLVVVLVVISLTLVVGDDVFEGTSCAADTSGITTSTDPDADAFIKSQYLKHSKTTQTLDNIFWPTDPSDCNTWPKLSTLSKEAMKDKLGVLVMKFKEYFDLAKLKYLQSFHQDNIEYGINVVYTDGKALEAEVKASTSFCHDPAIVKIPSENIFHGSQRCYREVTTKKQGMHICFGNNNVGEFHKDYTSPSTDRNDDGVCKYDPQKLAAHIGDICSQSTNVICQGLTKGFGNTFKDRFKKLWKF